MWKQNLSDLISMFDKLTLFQLPWNWEVLENSNLILGSLSLKEIRRPLFFNIRLNVKT